MRQFSGNKPGLNWPAAALTLGACLAGTAYGQYLPGNVCQPGDPIIASSANSPASEGVANAIDGTTAKYLNFDSAAATFKPSGFAFTPSAGATLINGISMETANDAPERDPQHVTVEGSNDGTLTNYASGNWTLIADIP